MGLDIWNKQPIIDGTTIIYSSAFAAQSGRGEEAVAEEASHAFYNAKLAVKKTLDKFNVDAHGWRLFLDGKDNFRKSLARIQPYKGNRPPKPLLYEEVKDYLVTFWQAEVVDGMEAEDMAAITYNLDPENSVFCAVDKDCLQVPGVHHNYQKETSQVISPLEGNRRLFSQILTGDNSTDAILGIPKLGEKAAGKLMKDVRTFRAGWEVCKEQYYKAFGEQRCFQKETPKGLRWAYEKGSGLVCTDGTVIDWREALEETCHLIYLLRSEGDRFTILD